MEKDNLDFGHDGNESLLDVKYYSGCGVVKLVIYNFELVKIIVIFDVLNAFLNIVGIINANDFCFAVENSK